MNRGRLSRRTENFSGPKIHLSNMQNNFRMILEATHENFWSKTMTQNGPREVLGSNKFLGLLRNSRRNTSRGKLLGYVAETKISFL